MNINYDSQFVNITNNLTTTPTLLLHVCCAPCATYCLTQLVGNYDVTLYFSNDNITSKAEFDKRLGEVEKLVDIINNGNFVVQPVAKVKLVVDSQDTSAFFAVSKGLENEQEGGARCSQCFALRLGKTANYAVANGFNCFATTLTVSPYKNSQIINSIGQSLQTQQTSWLPTDFKKRNGYKQSIELCAKYGIYRQHYCGCCYSQNDLLSSQN